MTSLRSASLAVGLLLVACGDDAAPDDAGPSIDSAQPPRDGGGGGEDAATDAGAPDSGVASDGGTPSTGLEGFGATTEGAMSSPDGFTECRVTSLADDGPGTLRDCVSAEKRHVVFDVGGTILLESDLNIPHSYVTVAGETAPAPGITIVQPDGIGTTIEASGSIGPVHDVIVRYLRMDGQADGLHTNMGDIWGLDGEAAEVHDVAIDHVTGIASNDGVMDVWWDVHDVTVSWSLIRDTVAALHLSGDGVRERISFHHNVFARNNERQIRVRHDTRVIDYVNNIVYGWGWVEAGAAGIHIVHDPGGPNPSLNVVANVFHFVPGLSGDPQDGVVFEPGADRGPVWFEDNLLDAAETDAVSTAAEMLPIPEAARVTTYPAAELRDRVLPTVGTHHRTPEEQALIDEIAAAL